MAFNGLVLTTKGRLLQSKVQTGVQLNYTKVDVGDGTLASGQSLESLNTLINKKMTLPITGVAVLGDGNSRVRTVIMNKGLATGFYVREYGLFATDPDVGEILYAVGNAGNECDYLPAGGGSCVVENQIDLITAIGNATNVTAVINASLVVATLQDLSDHNGNPDAHSLAMGCWQRQRAYAVGEVIRTRIHGSPKYMECTVGGTTAATEPTWPAVGQTIVDGNVTWRVCDCRQATAQFDNSGRMATTAWVSQRMGGLQGVVAATGNVTLAASDANKFVYQASNSGTVTLPVLSTVPIGSIFSFFCGTNGPMVIQRAGSDLIAVNGGTVTNMTLGAGSTFEIVAGPASWETKSGSAQLGNSAEFGSLISGPGYQKLPSGLIIQWGNGTTAAGGGLSIPLAMAFPHSCIAVAGSCNVSNVQPVAVNFYSTLSGITAFAVNTITGNGVGIGVWFIAIGC